MDKGLGRRTAALAGCLVAVLGLAGCATSPATQRALGQFSASVGQVAQAADRFLTDYADGARVQEERIRLVRGEVQAPQPDWPRELVLPDQAGPMSDRERALAAQRQAVRVLRGYAEVLVALGEGRTHGQLRDDVQQFAGSLRSYAGLLGAGGAITGPVLAWVPTLLKLADDAVNRRELERGVVEGQPLVRSIVADLRGSVPDLYRRSELGTDQAAHEVREALRGRAAVVRSMLARHARPADAAVDVALAPLQARLLDSGRRTGTGTAMPVFAQHFAAGGTPMTAASVEELRAHVAAMEDLDRRFAEVAARQRGYHALLLQYAATLVEVQQGLDRVAESLGAPVDLRAQAERLLEAATRLRAASEAYRTAR